MIFNFLFIAINVYQIIRLIKKKIPPKFTLLEEEVYNRDFKEVFSRNEFNLLKSYGRMEYLSSNESQICKVGQSFKEIIYIAQIHEGFSVELYDASGMFVSEVKQGSWIGIGEYAIRENYLKNAYLSKLISTGEYELVWEISAVIKEHGKVETETKKHLTNNIGASNTKPNVDNFVFLKKRSEGCIIYKFTIEVSNFY